MCWVFPSLKSTSHLLLQSTVSCKSDLSSEANCSCSYRSDAWSHLLQRLVSWALIAILQITLLGRSLIYSRKSVGQRMDHWGTQALTGYSYQNFLFRTTQSSLLLRKEETRPNIWPEIPKDFSLWRRSVCQILSKALDLSSATAGVAPGLLKTTSILSDTALRRSPVDQEHLKPYQKLEKRSNFFWWSTILFFKSFWNTLLITKGRLTRQ